MSQVMPVKWGNSQGIRLPKSVLKAANMEIGQPIEMTVERDVITLRAIRRGRTLDELFAGYSGDFKPVEFDTGLPVGAEVLADG